MFVPTIGRADRYDAAMSELLRDGGLAIVPVDDPHLCSVRDPEVAGQYADASGRPTSSVYLITRSVDSTAKKIKESSWAAPPCAVEPARRARRRSRPSRRYDPIRNQLGRLKVDHELSRWIQSSPGACDNVGFTGYPRVAR